MEIKLPKIQDTGPMCMCAHEGNKATRHSARRDGGGGGWELEESQESRLYFAFFEQ